MDKATILTWLEAVKDPEIPVLSLVDLGVIRDVVIDGSGRVTVKMTPTFSGCPAMDYMQRDVVQTLRAHGISDVTTEMSFEEPWDTNMVSEKGREALKNFGLAPPPTYQGILDLDILEYAQCPFCNSNNTELRTPFGATLCRSMHYCNDCRQLFEQFKPV